MLILISYHHFTSIFIIRRKWVDMDGGFFRLRCSLCEFHSLWSHIQTCCLKYSGHIEEVKKSFIAKTGIGAKGSPLQAETGTAEKDLNDF